MRCVVQRVRSASVEVDGKLVSKIGPGLLCLVGIREGDSAQDAAFLCKKLLKTRMWPHAETNKPWDGDVVSMGYEILLVSQFTLYGRLKKARPDYSKAMPPAAAKDFYEHFVAGVRAEYAADRVKDGVFGAMMDVSLVNDGPVTFVIDSAETD